MARVYMLGGRMFAPTESLTGRQDGYMIVQATDAGVFDLLTKQASGSGSANEYAIAGDLIVAAHRSNKFYHVIAARLVEDGKKWTPKDADANAEYFADLSAVEDKSQLTAAFVEVLQDFFTSAAASLARSQTASTTTTAASSETSSPRTDAPSTSSQGDTDGPSVPDSSPLATATA